MDDEDIAALVVDNGSGMCKGALMLMGHEMEDPKRRIDPELTTVSFTHRFLPSISINSRFRRR
jgi:hypothetical protein